MGPRTWRTGDRYEAAASAIGMAVAAPLLLGVFANLTVIFSAEFGGIVPFNFSMAFSASYRRSKRINPTPLDIPAGCDWNVHNAIHSAINTAQVGTDCTNLCTNESQLMSETLEYDVYNIMRQAVNKNRSAPLSQSFPISHRPKISPKFLKFRKVLVEFMETNESLKFK